VTPGRLEPEPAIEIVERGYDAIADRFAAWQKGITGSTRLEHVERLLERLPEGPHLHELGIGAGVRSSRLLAERGRLTGVDISREQLRRARARVPAATLVHADVMRLELKPASFDAVVALYVLNHVPRAELGPLLRRAAGWLRPGGLFLASFGAMDTVDAVEDDWLGVPMFFAGFQPETNSRLVREAGLDVVEDELERLVEPGQGEATFHWLLARKPSGD